MLSWYGREEEKSRGKYCPGSEDSSEIPEPEKEEGKRKALRWERGKYDDLIQTPHSNGRVYIARRLATSKWRCLLRF